MSEKKEALASFVAELYRKARRSAELAQICKEKGNLSRANTLLIASERFDAQAISIEFTED